MEHGQPPPCVARPSRRAIPERWIMIDRRLGDRADAIVAAMPPRSAVIIRPYAMEPKGRVGLIRAIVRKARARRHLIIWAGRRPPGFADGVHGGAAMVPMVTHHCRWLTLPVHNAREARRATRLRADAVLISPVNATASHPGAVSLGRARAHQYAAMAKRAAIALGGMDARRFRPLRGHGFAGWAAIDAWAVSATRQRQKRKRVPT